MCPVTPACILRAQREKPIVATQDKETDMKTRVLVGIAVLAVLALLAIGASSAETLFPRQAAGPGPEEAVEAFYNAYLAYSETANPMVDRAYREMPGLGATFVAEMDALFESGPVYHDPFLCAQDVPVSVSVGEPQVSGKAATVEVATIWYGNPMASLLTVELSREDGAWAITGIGCNPGAQRPLGAGETVTAFYALYLDMAQQGNPLADGRYAHMPFLSAEFVAEAEAALAGMGKGGFDPILHAQDVPLWVDVDSESVQEDQALVTAHTSFEGHRLEVELAQRNSAWEILAIRRAQ
jgi:hypothetical protein